jgi:hypothetical protein
VGRLNRIYEYAPSLRQLYDVGGGIFESDELAAGNWILECAGPGHYFSGSLNRFMMNSIFLD